MQPHHRHPVLRMCAPLVALLLLLGSAAAHGVIEEPPQRGCLRGESDFCRRKVSDDAPTDWNMHFPAGDKSFSPGAGQRSQRRAAGSRGWTPFTPLKPNFRWRAGVCGDDMEKRESPHVRGGEYYFNGMVSKTYSQGSVIDISLNIVGYHNGVIEFHLCDVSKCDGEISQKCFRTPGACHQLQRAVTSDCESGANRRCGPIDRQYPGRWYLPCANYPEVNVMDRFANGAIRYKLPDNVNCEHCVLQWYWAAANQCNPPGLREYFEGPNRPKNWGRCRGESGAEGGYASYMGTCGGDRFAEEYLQCADVRILPRNGRSATRAPPVSRRSTRPMTTRRRRNPPGNGSNNGRGQERGSGKNCGPYNLAQGFASGYGRLRDIVLRGDGCRQVSLNKVSYVDIRKFKWIAIEAIVEDGVRSVEFKINGNVMSTDRESPMLMFNGPWLRPIVNRPMTITITADGDMDSTTVTLTK